jgi:hypothetical protein
VSSLADEEKRALEALAQANDLDELDAVRQEFTGKRSMLAAQQQEAA